MKYKLFLLTTLLLFNLQFAALPVSACTPGSIDTTWEEFIDETSVMVVGTVTGSSGSDPRTANYTIQVESYLKGAGPDALLISGYGSGGGDCRNVIAIGERWLFFLNGDPTSDEVLQASYYYVYHSIEEASDENIASTSTLTGQSPTAP